MLLLFLTYSILLSTVSCRKIHIQVRENVTQSCPNVDSDVIDEDSVRISMKFLRHSDSSDDDGEKDEVTITGVNGETSRIDFPGCYRVKVSFRMRKPIENPYIEAFMQLGRNIPCQNEQSLHNLVGVASICANISTPTKWCPQSYNGELRAMLGGKSTCKFCNMCDSIKTNDSKITKLRKFVSNEGREECSTNDDTHKYTFKMCTPSREDLNQEETGTKEKIEQYWQYLKQGIMTTVIHVMDRSPINQTKQCLKMCETFGNADKIGNVAYKNTLQKSIERMCAPVDKYAACVYHTLKFDVNYDV